MGNRHLRNIHIAIFDVCACTSEWSGRSRKETRSDANGRWHARSATRTRAKKRSQPTDTDKQDVSRKMWNTSVPRTRKPASALANMATLIKCQHNEASKNKKYWILIYPHLLGSGFFLAMSAPFRIPAAPLLCAYLLGWRWCVSVGFSWHGQRMVFHLSHTSGSVARLSAVTWRLLSRRRLC